LQNKSDKKSGRSALHLSLVAGKKCLNWDFLLKKHLPKGHATESCGRIFSFLLTWPLADEDYWLFWFDDRIYRIRIRQFIDVGLCGDLFHENNSKQFNFVLEILRCKGESEKHTNFYGVRKKYGNSFRSPKACKLLRNKKCPLEQMKCCGLDYYMQLLRFKVLYWYIIE
jgi:hypothetical protein